MQTQSADSAVLWGGRIRSYVVFMARKYLNTPLLGDPEKRSSSLFAFLDGYSTALDTEPQMFPWDGPKGADVLWDDFVQVAGDVNSVIDKKVPSK